MATASGRAAVNRIRTTAFVAIGCRATLGVAPMGGLKVSACPHTVVLVRAEHGRKVRSITM